MSPPSAIHNGAENKPTFTTHEPGLSAAKANKLGGLSIPRPPTFEDLHAERKYLKERLAAAFRIFGKYGFDEGVAGHITVRVRVLWQSRITQLLPDPAFLFIGPSRPENLLGQPVWSRLLAHQGFRSHSGG